MAGAGPAGGDRPRGPDELARRVSAAQCVLFDLDGTLIDTMALILASFRHATATVLGAPLPDDLLMRNVGVPLRRQMHEFAPDKAEELLLAYREHNDRVHDELIAEYPGTEETLAELKRRGYSLGIVTSKSKRPAARGLASFGLQDYFDIVVTSDDTDVHKPDPEPLRVAARALGYPLAECLYVGDSPHDMTAARDGGAIAVAALWGGFTAEEVCAPGPHYAIGRIGDLTELLGGDEGRFRCRRDGDRRGA